MRRLRLALAEVYEKNSFLFKSWFTISIVIYAIFLYMGEVLVDVPITPEILCKQYVAALFMAAFDALISVLLIVSVASLQEKSPHPAEYYYTMIAMNSVTVIVLLVKKLISLSPQ